VVRVAASYAVIAWLALQIASVVLEPLGAPKWAMTALIIAAAVGFPIAIALAWFLEIGQDGVHVDTAAEGVPRPTARGLRHYADAIVIGILLVFTREREQAHKKIDCVAELCLTQGQKAYLTAITPATVTNDPKTAILSFSVARPRAAA
jgi:hypothetical protein